MASVLLIEGEALIRMMIADMLVELGHSVAGEAGDLQSGLLLVSAPGVDAAILDVQLGDHSSPSRKRCKAKAFSLPLRADMGRTACLKALRIIRFFKSRSDFRNFNAV
jgi:DNA-binding NarL/FixJ family response regulator